MPASDVVHKPRFPPGLGVAIVVVSVSFAAPLFRLAEAGAITASFWRVLLAVLILLPFSRSAWPAWRSYTARDWRTIFLTGAALAGHFALWVTSLKLTTVAAATTMVTLQAVFVAVGGHFLLKDRLGKAAILGIGVAIVGGFVITFSDANDPNAAASIVGPDVLGLPRAVAGDLIALAAGLGSAAYMLVGRHLRATRGLLEYVVPVYGATAIVLAVAALVLREPLVAGLGGRNFVFFVLLAAVPMLGGHTVSNWCLRYLPAHTIATWILLEPVGAALLAIPLVHEWPSWGVLAGGVLVILGAFLTIPRKATISPVATEPSG